MISRAAKTAGAILPSSFSLHDLSSQATHMGCCSAGSLYGWHHLSVLAAISLYCCGAAAPSQNCGVRSFHQDERRCCYHCCESACIETWTRYSKHLFRLLGQLYTSTLLMPSFIFLFSVNASHCSVVVKIWGAREQRSWLRFFGAQTAKLSEPPLYARRWLRLFLPLPATFPNNLSLQESEVKI